MTRYDAFIKVLETGSFSQAAQDLGYTQSAVSQMVHSLEEELNTTLIARSRRGLSLTPDGEEFVPYIRSVYNAHRELMEKKNEMQGLGSGLIRIATFTSVACNWLPGLIKEFKGRYPSVTFDLCQGDYNAIAAKIWEGSVDFGFLNPEAIKGLTLTHVPLGTDEMLAVLPKGHRLARRKVLSLAELTEDPFFLLDEGEWSEPLDIFRKNGLMPNVQYHVYDDYAIMSMIEQGLGITVLPALILSRCQYQVETRRITPPIVRNICLSYKNKKVLPVASRRFIDFIVERAGNLSQG